MSAIVYAEMTGIGISCLCFHSNFLCILCEVVLQFAGRDLLQSANTNNGKGQRKCSGTTYTLKSGDTLPGLVSKALEIKEKCSVLKIAKANPQIVITIFAGAKLCLPLGCKQPE